MFLSLCHLNDLKGIQINYLPSHETHFIFKISYMKTFCILLKSSDKKCQVITSLRKCLMK
jgi:hypothetical protein